MMGGGLLPTGISIMLIVLIITFEYYRRLCFWDGHTFVLARWLNKLFAGSRNNVGLVFVFLYSPEKGFIFDPWYERIVLQHK